MLTINTGYRRNFTPEVIQVNLQMHTVHVSTEIRINLSEEVFISNLSAISQPECVALLARKLPLRSVKLQRLMTNHGTFNTQLDHVSVASVHA